MKQPRVRYFLESNPDRFGQRRRKELVIAEVNAGFIQIVNGKPKYGRFKVSLEERIEPENFGYERENFKFNRFVLDAYSSKTKNNSLLLKMNRFENNVILVYNYFLANQEQPTAEEFKQELLTRLGRKERYKAIVTKPTLREAIAKVIDDENKMSPSASDKNRAATIKTYNTLLHHIERYEHVTGKTLELDNFNKETYMHFWKIQNDIVKGVIKCEIDAQRKVATTSYGMLSSSANKCQNVMKTLLIRTGYSIPLNFNEKGLIAKKTSNRKSLYLTEDELIKVMEYKAKDEKLILTQDYVILSSLLGMRYESMSEAYDKSIEIGKSDAGDFFYIHSKQNKTNTEAYIPLFEPAKKVIERHNGKFPKFPANSKINKSIKELLMTIGLDRMEQTQYFPFLDEPFSMYEPVYELISTHDFRKTFYTNLSILNVPESTIDLVTHPSKSSQKMSKVYNKSTLLDRARKFHYEVSTRLKHNKSSVYFFE